MQKTKSFTTFLSLYAVGCYQDWVYVSPAQEGHFRQL